MPGGRPRSAEHGTDSRYRYGCRCALCRDAHAEVSYQTKHEKRFGEGAPCGPQWRREVLRSLKATGNVMETAKRLGVTHQAIYATARAVEDFGEQVVKLTQPRM